jgi:uncharacterized protein (DUF983 family)
MSKLAVYIPPLFAMIMILAPTMLVLPIKGAVIALLYVTIISNVPMIIVLTDFAIMIK